MSASHRTTIGRSVTSWSLSTRVPLSTKRQLISWEMNGVRCPLSKGPYVHCYPSWMYFSQGHPGWTIKEGEVGTRSLMPPLRKNTSNDTYMRQSCRGEWPRLRLSINKQELPKQRFSHFLDIITWYRMVIYMFGHQFTNCAACNALLAGQACTTSMERTFVSLSSCDPSCDPSQGSAVSGTNPFQIVRSRLTALEPSFVLLRKTLWENLAPSLYGHKLARLLPYTIWPLICCWIKGVRCGFFHRVIYIH